METNELKFLLKLLEFEGYRAPLSQIKLNPKLSQDERDQICRELCDRGLIVCSYKIKKFKIAPPGKFLLKQNLDHLPLTKQERKVLRASAKGTITPKEIDIPAQDRQAVIQSLADRSLIEVKTKGRKIQEVRLTERGKEYLQYEYQPHGSSAVFNPEVLTNYLQFLRKSFQEVSPPLYLATQIISDEKILLTIQELDRQLATNNRLPIFHLREKLQPLVSNEELDEILYRLKQSDKIELGALATANASAFTSEQIDAGMVRYNGEPLFFVTLK